MPRPSVGALSLIALLLSLFTGACRHSSSAAPPGRRSNILLIIADDLDKVDLASAEEIFYRHSRSLIQPNCKIIFTVPVSMIYSPNLRQIQMSFQNTITLPLPKMKNKAGEINKDWIDTFKGIVSKRVSTALFEKGVLTKLALQSGGLVVDYLRMVRDCLVKAKVRNMDKVDEDSAGETFDDLISDYRRVINEEFYEKLKDVNENKKTENDDDLRRLLHILAILEYVDNSENWYDVHPAIEPLLLEKGLIK
ncbi:MAG: hypothetical protein IH975_06645 [Nitrospinae bacterium]|nr:hypothetical protein [Nitrospinota bacterium]